ncbi:MAG: hypothetical protein JRN68_03515 [Nitrososphaerota archaeon]|nr:hypothetical protein [Nitrososphaerota archaeon]
MPKKSDQKVMISVEPYKRIVIRSYMQYESPELLLRAMTAHVPLSIIGRIGSFLWSNEIVFKHVSFPNNAAVSKELLSGNLWIDHIDFAHMPKFQTGIKSPEGDMVFSVIDMTGHTTFDTLTSWMKSNILIKS